MPLLLPQGKLRIAADQKCVASQGALIEDEINTELCWLMFAQITEIGF